MRRHYSSEVGRDRVVPVVEGYGLWRAVARHHHMGRSLALLNAVIAGAVFSETHAWKCMLRGMQLKRPGRRVETAIASPPEVVLVESQLAERCR